MVVFLFITSTIIVNTTKINILVFFYAQQSNIASFLFSTPKIKTIIYNMNKYFIFFNSHNEDLLA